MELLVFVVVLIVLGVLIYHVFATAGRTGKL